jgi:hypothetical protein
MPDPWDLRTIFVLWDTARVVFQPHRVTWQDMADDEPAPKSDWPSSVH